MKKRLKELFNNISEFTLNTGSVVILIILLRIFVISPFEVEGHSMYTTLHDRDYILIDKISYRITEPERGDIVIVRPPHIQEKTFFVKRIVGMPGDVLTFDDNYVHVNGEKIREDYLQSPFIRTHLSPGSPETITIPDDGYFIIGDNRSKSSDSRRWLTDTRFKNQYNDAGAITKNDIIGKVRLVAFNLNEPFKRWKILKDPDYTSKKHFTETEESK